MIPKTLYILVIAGIIFKLLLGVFFNTYAAPEEFEYETIANNILAGKGFLYNFHSTEYRAFVQPLYPVLSAVIYFLTNHNQAVLLIIQCIVSSSISFVVYLIAMRLAGPREALLAALLTLFHPGLSVYSIFKLHPLVFDAFLYVLSLNLIITFIKQPNVKLAAFTGSCIGLALLSRITILPFALFSILYAFFLLKNLTKGKKAVYILIIFLSAGIIYSPWVIRNYKVFNRLVFAQTSSGENLWVGNNILASGAAILSSGKSIHELMPLKMRKELSELDELGQVEYYKSYFFNFIKDNPLLFARLCLKKFYYFWWFTPRTGTLYNKPWLYTYKVYYGFLLIMFFVGIASSLRSQGNRHAIFLIIIFMLSIAFLHSLVNIDTRHRWTIEPAIIIFSSIGFFTICDYIFKNYRKTQRETIP